MRSEANWQVHPLPMYSSYLEKQTCKLTSLFCLTGLINEMELGAQTIVYQLETIAVVFPVGISIAGNVRVGNSLGAKNTEQAKLSAKSAMLCAVSVSICPATFFGALKDYIPYVFTNDELSLGGIIRGTGRQKIGAICNILGFYGVGLPVGVSLMFAAKLKITGLWIGLLTCIFLQTSFLTVYLSRLNWKKVTEEAQIRVGNASNTNDDQLDLIMAQFLGLALGFVSTVFCGHLGRVELDSVSLAITGIIWPEVITGIFVNLLNALLNYIFLYPLNMGVAGSAVANTLSQFSLMGILYCYIVWTGLYKATWTGISIAGNVRVGNSLGAKNTEQAKLSAKSAMLCAGLWIGLLTCIFLQTSFLTIYLSRLNWKKVTEEIMAQFLGLALGFVSTVFCGHLGRVELDSVSLAITGIIWPEVITGIFVNLLNALLNYIFLYPLNMGVAGSALANTLSQVSLMGILYCYIVWTGLYKATWTAIPSMVMMCVEWWTYEIGSFLAGFSIAGNVRVGNSLGAKNTEQAKLSAKSAMLCAGLWIGLLTCKFLQTSFLIFYLSWLNWKKVTEEVSV
ncbi:unnamed protein product [Tetraodon nigroviridis]|uniref:Multidrug and toxin extrusion protein n=1 Tax=Tetraodon nigroviridis TaxID=99883 RepID=Q4RRN8_TETNG|nr:unnamed protein product [Tetraodon nigroviridis]